MANWNYHQDSDDELADTEEKAFGGRSAVIVVIDSSPEMFQEWKDGQVPFKAALKCCQSMWRSKVVSSQKDLVSLLFFGTEQSKNSLNFENIYQLQELSTVKVEMIEQLNAMKNSDDYNGFESDIGSSENYDLKELFWLLKIIIDEGKATNFQKKVIYFTCNDSPHSGKSIMQQEAVKKFKDMGKVELSIVAFNDEFNLDNFYSKIVEDQTSIIRADNIDDLMKVVRVKQRLRRPISRTTLDLGEGLKMGIGFYSFVRPATKARPVRINKHTSEVLEKTTNEFRGETGMPVLKSEERRIVKVQGEVAIFTKDEIKQAKISDERGVQLIGFLNGNALNSDTSGNDDESAAETSPFNHFSWYRSPGYFIYPDEERITGSRDLFVALLKRCHTLNKIILVKMVLSRGRSPKLACLIPSLEGDNALFPQGFHVFPVPFADEMRQYDFEFNTPAIPELTELMEKVIKKISNKKFDLLDIYNPMVQHHWRELEKIALDLSEEDLDEFDDLTVPNEELMVERFGDLPDQIIAELDKIPFDAQKSNKSVRKVDANLNMAMEVKNNRVEKLTIPILKSYLESESVNTSQLRKKADYVAAVYAHFQKGGN